MKSPPSPLLRHVVIVLDNANIDGGSAKVALSSAGALADLGYDVHVISAVPASVQTRASLPKTIQFIATEQLDILKDPSVVLAAARGLWNDPAYRLVRGAIAPLERSSTVVHVHGWTKALSSSVIRAGLDERFVTAIGLHEYFTICPIGSLFDHGKSQICYRTPMSLDCIAANCDSRSYAHKVYRVLRHAVSRQAGGVATRVKNYIAVSDFSRAIIASHLPPDARIYNVANPVDVPRSDRVDVARNDRYVYIGRLSAEKGPLLFAEAMRCLGGKAIFAGDGELSEAVRAILPEAEITGWLDRAGLAATLQRARAIVVPSLWYETFGLVVLEAAGGGIPAIVPDLSAARDLIVDGQTGLLFRTGDVASLVRALRQCGDDTTIERLGAGAYDRYWDNPFTLENHITSLVAAYEAMLSAE